MRRVWQGVVAALFAINLLVALPVCLFAANPFPNNYPTGLYLNGVVNTGVTGWTLPLPTILANLINSVQATPTISQQINLTSGSAQTVVNGAPLGPLNIWNTFAYGWGGAATGLCVESGNGHQANLPCQVNGGDSNPWGPASTSTNQGSTVGALIQQDGWANDFGGALNATSYTTTTVQLTSALSAGNIAKLRVGMVLQTSDGTAYYGLLSSWNVAGTVLTVQEWCQSNPGGTSCTTGTPSGATVTISPQQKIWASNLVVNRSTTAQQNAATTIELDCNNSTSSNDTGYDDAVSATYDGCADAVNLGSKTSSYAYLARGNFISGLTLENYGTYGAIVLPPSSHSLTDGIFLSMANGGSTFTDAGFRCNWASTSIPCLSLTTTGGTLYYGLFENSTQFGNQGTTHNYVLNFYTAGTTTADSTITASGGSGSAGDGTLAISAAAVTDSGTLSSGAHTINLNTDSTPVLPTISNAGINLTGADGAVPTQSVTSLAAANAIDFYRGDGTATTPTALADQDIIAALDFGGYDAAAWNNNSAIIRGYAAGTWSNTSHPTKFKVQTTPASSTTAASVLTIESDGTLYVGSSTNSTAKNTGAGTVNVDTSYNIANTNIQTGKAATTATTASPGSVTATSPTYKMLGLAGTITPTWNTKIRVSICGSFTDATLADDVTYILSYGTGTAPTNGGSLAGTQTGAVMVQDQLVASKNESFCTEAVITGLTAGTAYWLDLAVGSAGGHAVTFGSTNVSASEI